jgi:hypothetical protein
MSGYAVIKAELHLESRVESKIKLDEQMIFLRGALDTN